MAIKTYDNAALATMSLKQLSDLVGIKSIVKMAKGKAIARTIKELDALGKYDDGKSTKPTRQARTPKVTAPSVKVGPYRADSKFGQLYVALGELRTRVELMGASGFDNKNLSVALSIMKRADVVIKMEADKTDKTMRYVRA